MARYTGPRVRISRRFGIPIFGPSKYLERRNYGPGVHGPKSRRKHTDYGLGLIENAARLYASAFELLNCHVPRLIHDPPRQRRKFRVGRCGGKTAEKDEARGQHRAPPA